MKVRKEVIGRLPKCYALAPITYQGAFHFLAASELPEKCLLFSAEGKLEDVVWEKPGGVMSMVYVPGTDGEFLAVNRFYSFNDAAEAVITLASPAGEHGWQLHTLAELPYVHRIDLIEHRGCRWLIACQLKSGQDHDNDWSYPGKVQAARLPEDLNTIGPDRPLELRVLKDGLLKNHGYCRVMEGDTPACLVSSESGIYRFTPPDFPDRPWKTKELCGDPASEAVLLDLDGDGAEELCTISPFHGDRVRIYHRNSSGGFRLAHEHEKSLPFCHAFYGGRLAGRNRLIVGQRAGDRDLLAFSFDRGSGRYVCEVLDHDAGSANVMVYRQGGRDILVSANREKDEIALYRLEP